jgi:hypothetical protein
VTSLTDLAESLMTVHGWTTRREADVAKAGFAFDLIAESQTAIVFFETVSGSRLQK